MTRNARQGKILELIEEKDIETQEELVKALIAREAMALQEADVA